MPCTGEPLSTANVLGGGQPGALSPVPSAAVVLPVMLHLMSRERPWVAECLADQRALGVVTWNLLVL